MNESILIKGNSWIEAGINIPVIFIIIVVFLIILLLIQHMRQLNKNVELEDTNKEQTNQYHEACKVLESEIKTLQNQLKDKSNK
jgi:predicted Holliday junction resolvase-like endonuclease